MDKKTWIDRMSSEDYWIMASKLEREGKFEEASEYYLKEAKLRSGSPAMAALSYLSAARCLSKIARMKEARRYYRLAGENYERYAEEVIEVSPNSAVWGYVTASKCFMWSEDEGKAKENMDKARAIADKLDIKPPEIELSGDIPIFKAYRGKRKTGKAGKGS